MKFKLPLALLLLASSTSLAQAESYAATSRKIISPSKDNYIAVSGGIDHVSTTKVLNTADNKQEWNWGGAGHIAYGNMMETFQAEIEASFYGTSLEKHLINGSRVSGVTGSLYHYALMANIIQNYRLNDSIQYFLAGGIGATMVQVNVKGPVGTANRVKRSQAITMAFQAYTGFSFEIAHNIELIAQYRAFTHLKTKHKIKEVNSDNTRTLKTKSPVIQSIEGGFRYYF